MTIAASAGGLLLRAGQVCDSERPRPTTDGGEAVGPCTAGRDVRPGLKSAPGEDPAMLALDGEEPGLPPNLLRSLGARLTAASEAVR